MRTNFMSNIVNINKIRSKFGNLHENTVNLTITIYFFYYSVIFNSPKIRIFSRFVKNCIVFFCCLYTHILCTAV